MLGRKVSHSVGQAREKLGYCSYLCRIWILASLVSFECTIGFRSIIYFGTEAGKESNDACWISHDSRTAQQKMYLALVVDWLPVAISLLSESRGIFIAESEFSKACEVTRKLILVEWSRIVADTHQVSPSRVEAYPNFESTLSLLKLISAVS